MTPQFWQRVCPRFSYRAKDPLAGNDTAPENDAGFSLLEVVVSFTLFAIVAGGATTGIVSALQASHSSQQRIDAANIGQLDLALDLASYRAGTMPQKTIYTKTLTNESFSIARQISFTPSSATACSPGVSFTVHVEVSQGQTGAFLAQTDTVIAC